MKLQSINKVELQGHVGAVRTTECQGKLACRMSVATNYAFKGKDDNWTIETVWHSVWAWEGKNISRDVIESVQKGSPVHIVGRIRSTRYTTLDGGNRVEYEILANEIEKLDAELEPQQ